MEKTHSAYFESVIGILEISGTEEGISGVRFVEKRGELDQFYPAPLQECLRQFHEYFKGKRREFSLPLIPDGTSFQKKVWNQLLKIPYAATVSYKEVARAVQNEKAVRAVGRANANNRIGIIIPCHRVIAHNGTLGGYGGGLWRKQWLLHHEKCHLGSLHKNS